MLVTIASTLGSAGAIAGSFALSFLVFDETGSTLASAWILSMQLIPHILIQQCHPAKFSGAEISAGRTSLQSECISGDADHRRRQHINDSGGTSW